MDANRPSRRSRALLFVAIFLVSLLLVAWGVWGLATSFPDPLAHEVVNGVVIVPVPTGTAGIR
jgi:hypothetical protein